MLDRRVRDGCAAKVPGDRAVSDHVPAQISRLPGASYPVRAESHPVSVTSLTAHGLAAATLPATPAHIHLYEVATRTCRGELHASFSRAAHHRCLRPRSAVGCGEQRACGDTWRCATPAVATELLRPHGGYAFEESRRPPAKVFRSALHSPARRRFQARWSSRPIVGMGFA